MSKRKYESKFFEPELKRVSNSRDQIKKHTLDSDEEDYVDEDNVLDENDIEGEEEGMARQDGEQRMTAFNMKEEMEEGHFDKEGHYIWNNEREIRDNWLDNIDWQKIESNFDSRNKYDIEEKGLGAESDSESENETEFDAIATYKKMIQYMKPKETVNKSLKRLGGADMKLSSVERLRRKKAGLLTKNEDVTNLTELADQILTNLGNMDIYQETYEQIQMKIDSVNKKNKQIMKEPSLDMYADDFDIKEKQKVDHDPSTSKTTVDNSDYNTGKSELKWEFKWKADDTEIQGPFTTAQMIKWKHENYFKAGVMVRYGESSNFYSLNRIDFEVYE